MEEEANLFARCILMPESLLRSDLADLAKMDKIGDLLDDNNPFLAKLANRYQVPVVAMTLRLAELGLLK